MCLFSVFVCVRLYAGEIFDGFCNIMLIQKFWWDDCKEYTKQSQKWNCMLVVMFLFYLKLSRCIDFFRKGIHAHNSVLLTLGCKHLISGESNAAPFPEGYGFSILFCSCICCVCVYNGLYVTFSDTCLWTLCMFILGVSVFVLLLFCSWVLYILFDSKTLVRFDSK